MRGIVRRKENGEKKSKKERGGVELIITVRCGIMGRRKAKN